MRHINILAAVAATVLLGGMAGAKDQPQAPKEKKICRIQDDSTSRITAKRICRTKAEWEQGSDEAQRDAERAIETLDRRH
jgi:hypothetical protein